MATERTRDELDGYDRDRAAIRVVLDRARQNLASWITADRLDLDPDVCEQWVNIVWDDLRESLDGEQRVFAILMLIEPEAKELATELLLAETDGAE